MRKQFIITVLTILMTTIAISSEATEPAKKKVIEPPYAGILIRGGYGFNYDAFVYGISLIYQFNDGIGVTAGFDGYYFPNMYTTLSDGNITKLTDHKFPLWNIRGGIIIFNGHLAIGGMCGKWTIDNPNLINMRDNAWFATNTNAKILYGGFATVILPFSEHFGMNIDVAFTNKTGFNTSLGFNFTLPIK